MLSARFYMVLCYAGIILGSILLCWELQWAALSFLFAIACAQIAWVRKSEQQNRQTQESLYIILRQFTALQAELTRMGRQSSPGGALQSAPLARTYRKAAAGG